MCFLSLSCCISQVCLSFMAQTNSRTFSFRQRAEFTVPSITVSQPGPEAAQKPQTITLLPPCSTVIMMFLFWNAFSFTPDLTGVKTSKKLNLSLISPHNISPNILRNHQDVFFQMWDERLGSFWWAVFFPPWCHLCPVSSLLLYNSDSEESEACSSFDVVLGFLCPPGWVEVILLG